ncbi:MAG: acyl-CoA dehydrogenase family protein [Bacillota bacterium]
MRFASYEQGQGLNWWETDPNLQQVVARYADPAMLAWARPHLARFGELCGTRIALRADYTDKAEGRPRLLSYDRQGNEISRVIYNPGYLQTVAEAYGAGIVAWRHTVPEGAPGPVDPVITWAMGYMLGMAETGFYCPVALTGSCALAIDRFAPPELRARYLPGLIATDPEKLTQGATWLTEKTGGSDVGAITTVARQEGDVWKLTGEKWFASNADAPVALALARPEGAGPGTAGLALFLIPRTLPDGRQNSYRIRRLKEKLGVIAVPSGEVLLEGAEAFLIGGPGQGFKMMMEAINLSRVYNAIGSCGVARRAFLESVIYTSRRIAFGKPVAQHPLMRSKLLRMLVELEAATALAFRAADAYEKGEPGYRLLIPIAKARTAEVALQLARASIECLGGNGYIEEYVTPRLLRDAQVLTVWEGPEHILALELMRVLAKEGPDGLLAEIDRRLKGAASLDEIRQQVTAHRDALIHLINEAATSDPEQAQLHALRILNRAADALSGAYLMEEAAGGPPRKAEIARLYLTRLHRLEEEAQRIWDHAVLHRFDSLVQ